MSPEQLLTLQNLSILFKDGRAGPEQIKQLSELLASINHQNEPNDLSQIELIEDINQY